MLAWIRLGFNRSVRFSRFPHAFLPGSPSAAAKGDALGRAGEGNAEQSEPVHLGGDPDGV